MNADHAAAVELLIELRRKVVDASAVLPLLDAAPNSRLEELDLDALAAVLVWPFEQIVVAIDKELNARGVPMLPAGVARFQCPSCPFTCDRDHGTERLHGDCRGRPEEHMPCPPLVPR